MHGTHTKQKCTYLLMDQITKVYIVQLIKNNCCLVK